MPPSTRPSTGGNEWWPDQEPESVTYQDYCFGSISYLINSNVDDRILTLAHEGRLGVSNSVIVQTQMTFYQGNRGNGGHVSDLRIEHGKLYGTLHLMYSWRNENIRTVRLTANIEVINYDLRDRVTEFCINSFYVSSAPLRQR